MVKMWNPQRVLVFLTSCARLSIGEAGMLVVTAVAAGADRVAGRDRQLAPVAHVRVGSVFEVEALNTVALVDSAAKAASPSV